MDNVTNGMTTSRLTPEEIETLLADRYSGKLQPVDQVQLKRVRAMQKQQETWKLAILAGRKTSPRDTANMDHQ